MKLSLVQTLKNLWLANEPVVLLEGPELYRMQTAVETAVQELNSRRTGGRVISTICHDRLQAFHWPDFSLKLDDGPHQGLLAAIEAIFGTADTIQQDGQKMVRRVRENENSEPITMSADPAGDIVFMLKGWESDFAPVNRGDRLNNDVVQAIRNIVQGNLCRAETSPEDGTIVRGKRMLVFLSAAVDIPASLPEIKPITVSLPNEDDLGPLVKTQFQKMQAAKRVNEAAEGSLPTVTKSLIGLTYEAADKALALSLVENSGFHFPQILETIERRKALHISETPGLQYISREELASYGQQPGYERLTDFVLENTDVADEDMQRHNLRSLQGVVVVGTPGVGKTAGVMSLARELGRMLVIWNIGETMSKYVSESEHFTRQVLNTVNAMGAMVLLDDIDKAGLDITKSQGDSDGGSGVMKRVVNAILTEMSKPDNRAIFGITGNRLSGIPPELLRAERIDGQFFVEMPNADTRLRILQYHVRRRNFDWLSLTTFMEELNTRLNDWNGADIAAMINKAGKFAVRRGFHALSEKAVRDWMADYAATTVPQARQAVYKKDLEEMTRQAADFIHIGNADPVAAASIQKRTRERHVEIV